MKVELTKKEEGGRWRVPEEEDDDEEKECGRRSRIFVAAV